MKIGKELAQKIKERRKELGINQRQASRMAGLSQGFFSQLESGRDFKASPETITKLCYILNVEPKFFGTPYSEKELLLPHHKMIESFKKWVDEEVKQIARMISQMMGATAKQPFPQMPRIFLEHLDADERKTLLIQIRDRLNKALSEVEMELAKFKD